jgi:dipeptidyl aminopeptidase/acylaminoacyl peptidase
VLAAPAALTAQTGYRQPPAPIAQVLDAPATPTVAVSPDRSTLLLLDRPGLPPIAEVSAPELRLAGLRFDPRSSGPTRATAFTGVRLLPVAGGEPRAVQMTLPRGATLANLSWSPDGRRMAFTVATDDTITLWIGDPASASARQVTPKPLNAVLGAPCDWVSSAQLACRFIPDGAARRRPAPPPPTAPSSRRR